MNAPKGLLILLALSVPLLAAAWQAPEQQEGPGHSHSQEKEADQRAEMGAMEAMASHHMHADPHMRMTEPRPPTGEDLKRADELIRTLRSSLEPYQDYRVALRDGYQPFLPNVPLPVYHFTNYRTGFLAAFRFDPAHPTSLLYRKTAEGYELVGAMYTAPRTATDEELDRRVPLSVVRWHQHVNFCQPPGQAARADWTKFGFKGSIATKEECEKEGGRFLPVIFGWMVHVHPFEQTPEKIWAH